MPVTIMKVNLIYKLRDIQHLSMLQNLTSLSIQGNPMATLPHAKLFVVFYLQSLSNLEGISITEDDRQFAKDRFYRGTVT